LFRFLFKTENRYRQKNYRDTKNHALQSAVLLISCINGIDQKVRADVLVIIGRKGSQNLNPEKPMQSLITMIHSKWIFVFLHEQKMNKKRPENSGPRFFVCECFNLFLLLLPAVFFA
jgi:hypothetical protein